MGTVTKLPPINHNGAEHWIALIDALAAPTLIFDRNLVFIAQNAAHEAMTGSERANVLGRAMFDVFPPEPGPDSPSAERAIRASVQRVWTSQQPDTLPIQEHALQADDGSWQTLSWKVTHAPILQDGEVVAILQTAENVTDATLERALNEAQRLAAQDAAAISFFSYELGSQLFVRTAAVDALFGFDESEAGPLAGPFFDRIHPDDLPDVFGELGRIADRPLGEPARFDYRVNVPGMDHPRHVRIRGAMVIDPADRQQKLIGVLVDMTDFELARERLEQALRDKENLLIEVNHRVKNSLQLASSVLRMEARKTTNPETQAVLAKANARVDAIAEVHGGIYMGGDVTRVRTDKIVDSIVDALGRSVGAGDTSSRIDAHTVAFSLPTDLAIAFGLLLNELLTNALKYGGNRDARAITVKTAIDGETASLTISNDSQDDGETETADGTGIGTSLIQGFVRQLGGSMETQFRDGRFTARITFLLHPEPSP